jgi:thiol-disulfide isomerase/thioredoxin
MNKTLIGVIVAALVLGGAGWFVMSGKTSSEPAMETHKEPATMEKEMKEVGSEDSMKAGSGSMMEKESDPVMMEKDSMMKKGSYESYAPEKLAHADSGKVVLFFRASWCPTCRTLDADIRAHLADIPVGTVILDVDYDTSVPLRQKYGVTYQHTFVQVDAQGNTIVKWAGSPTLSALLSNVR